MISLYVKRASLNPHGRAGNPTPDKGYAPISTDNCQQGVNYVAIYTGLLAGTRHPLVLFLVQNHQILAVTNTISIMRNFLHTYLPHARRLTMLATTASTRRMLLSSAVALCAALPLHAADTASTTTSGLDALTEQRQTLTAELEQYEQTLALLNPEGVPPEESTNPAVRKLALQAMLAKERLLAIAAEEVTLLQQEIQAGNTASKALADSAGIDDDEVLIAQARLAARTTIEGKPLRTLGTDYTRDKEAENVERLHELLQDYFAQVQNSANILPTEEEVAARQKSQRDIENLARIPYSADKVRLTGAEGSTALAHITRRLMNPAIPESRRDSAPICAIKTYLFDTLVASENRSLAPVGKNHYVARVRLQPGESTLNVMNERWEVSLPQQTMATDYLITYYKPPGRPAQLHLFTIEDLLALESPHIPAWLPKELNLQIDQG